MTEEQWNIMKHITILCPCQITQTSQLLFIQDRIFACLCYKIPAAVLPPSDSLGISGKSGIWGSGALPGTPKNGRPTVTNVAEGSWSSANCGTFGMHIAWAVKNQFWPTKLINIEILGPLSAETATNFYTIYIYIHSWNLKPYTIVELWASHGVTFPKAS